MCHIFAGQAPENYECQTRSMRIGGHSTSIRLEAAYWSILEQVAAHQGMSLGKFITKLHDEVLELHGTVNNFASLLRCSCLIYLTDVKPAPVAQHRPRYSCDTGRIHTGPVHLEAAE